MSLREQVAHANSMLVENDLAALTWGNASGIDRNSGLVVIKPSGIACRDVRPADLAVVDLDGNIVEGDLRPSSDLFTHLALYKAWPDIGGVVHTHSTYATAFAQAGRPIPCYGTTQADFCPGDVPCIPGLSPSEVETDYELNTGRAIVRHYESLHLEPLEYPAALMTFHGPFVWGRSPMDAADNALILENVAKMAFLSRMISPVLDPLPKHILLKHHQRKHGPNAYYGQSRE